MSTKAGTAIVVAGGVIAFLGLCFLPGAFGEQHDATLLAAGGSLFAFGTMLASSGLYLKARLLRSELEAKESSSHSTKVDRRLRSGCDHCHAGNPAVLCKVHGMHLCSDCLSTHYDFRSCVYAPSPRRVTASGRAMAAKAHA
jgi:hypothetical protein